MYENYESHYSVLTLVFLKKTKFKKKKQKSMSKIEILKKKSIFQSKLFSKKNKFVFLFFVRIMRAIISSLLLCLWKRPCLERKKKSVLYWDSEKSLYFFIFFRILFRKNELWFSVFIRIMKYIFFLMALVFVKKTVFKKKKSVDSILRFWKKSLLFHFFSNFFFEKMTYDF